MAAHLRVAGQERHAPPTHIGTAEADPWSDGKARDLIAEIGRTRRLPASWPTALEWPLQLDDGPLLPLRDVDSSHLRQESSRSPDDFAGSVLLIEAMELADVANLGELLPEHVAARELREARNLECRRLSALYDAWADGRIDAGEVDITAERFLGR